ncbi:MAG TPA: hypothetical protein VHR41_20635 [Gemmatimonadales bacterium]|nr:hypothetical protein [Gemmatimonadales bacterium]
MARRQPVSPTIGARLIHAALVVGVVLFWMVAWYAQDAEPSVQLPDRRVLYVSLTIVAATLFGAAGFTASRLVPPRPGSPPDEWWRANLGRAVVIWALVEAPALLGTIAYLLTRDFRALLAPFIGLLLFANYRPSRLTGS